MKQLPAETLAVWGEFLRGPHGQAAINWLMANEPAMPPEFTPADQNLQPQHVQLAHGFNRGARARLRQLVEWSEAGLPAPKPATESPVPKLHDTRTLHLNHGR